MSKLALSDDILLKVEKAARYTGGEINSVFKDKRDINIRFAMCFPDVYEIGMSNLGIQIIYDLINKYDDAWCERVFCPWPDLADIMRAENIPLFALESQEPIKDFDFLGISLGFEMCYTNILEVLDLSGIPLRSKDRSENDPIVIAGGVCTYNPAPIADFFDMFYIGEGEVGYDALFSLYREYKANKINKNEFLNKASYLPGIYVPNSDNKNPTKRIIEKDMDNTTYPLNPVIPNIHATQDRMVLEIQRGCIRGCRFCQAGFVYRPNREKNKNLLLSQAKTLMKNTGYEEISLSSLSSSDYDELPEFLTELIDICNENMINISLPSLRIDNTGLDIMKKIGDVRKTSITFAPEAGSQRMRNIINKNITYDDIIKGAEIAYKSGFTNIKLYFMLGLPFETDEDIKEIADIAEDLAMLFFDTIPKEERQGKVHITVSTSFFVPKPFTPFQWAKMQPIEEYKRKAHLLKDTIKQKTHNRIISYQWHAPDVTILEGVFARGDEKISDVIECAFKKSCRYDAWTDFFDFDKWMDSFKECGINPDDYTIKGIDEDTVLPWDNIDIGVSKRFLLNEYNKAKEEKTTENCKLKCSGCGCMCFDTGVCNEHKN